MPQLFLLFLALSLSACGNDDCKPIAEGKCPDGCEITWAYRVLEGCMDTSLRIPIGCQVSAPEYEDCPSVASGCVLLQDQSEVVPYDDCAPLPEGSQSCSNPERPLQCLEEGLRVAHLTEPPDN